MSSSLDEEHVLPFLMPGLVQLMKALEANIAIPSSNAYSSKYIAPVLKQLLPGLTKAEFPIEKIAKGLLEAAEHPDLCTNQDLQQPLIAFAQFLVRMKGKSEEGKSGKCAGVLKKVKPPF